MRHLPIMLCLALLPGVSWAQAASATEQTTVQELAPCLVQNAPEDWTRLVMVIRLDKVGDETGEVRYFAMRYSTPGEPVAYVPCDAAQPARTLLQSRKDQAPDKRGWTGARLMLERDGKFALSYDYP